MKKLFLILFLLSSLNFIYNTNQSSFAQSGRSTSSPQKTPKEISKETEQHNPTLKTSSSESSLPGGIHSHRRPPTKSKQKDEPEGAPIFIETNLVSTEVVVYNKKSGAIYQGLKKENFTLLEDGVKQEISHFRSVESPITLVMILEYNRLIGPIRNEVILPAAQFIQNFIKPEDYVSIVAYDLRPKVLNDFTNNSSELGGTINLLIRSFPTFSESNLFDALKFVLKGGSLDGEEYTGLEEVEGRTAILLVASGIDTFSKINYDQARKIVENAGVPVYSIGIGNFFYKLNDTRMSPEQNLTFLQAFNTLRTFSESTGGKYFPVTFPGELPTTLRSINAMMRNQYSLGYSPSNANRQGKRRKIELLVDVNGDGKPDNKELQVQYRKSYIEPGKKK